MASTRILLLAGSTAPASPASRLAAAFSRELAFLDAEATLVALADYPLPLHDADDAPPPPGAVQKLRGLFQSHAGSFVATPALDGAMPALVRNLFEWLRPTERRRSPAPLVALAAVADDDWGAASALADLERAAGRSLGATIIGGGLAVGRAGLAFDARGRLDDPLLAARLQQLAKELVHSCRRLVPDA